MADDDLVTVFVEIPKGSRNKYEYDDELGGIVLDRMLFTSMQYPADYGFIEGTLGEDGDPLDVMVLSGEPTFPGCRIRARPVGLFRMWDEKGPDEKIIAAPMRDPTWSDTEDLGTSPPACSGRSSISFRSTRTSRARRPAQRGSVVVTKPSG